MTQRAVQQAGKAAKASAVILKKAAVAVTKAASALVSALAGIAEGGIQAFLKLIAFGLVDCAQQLAARVFF